MICDITSQFSGLNDNPLKMIMLLGSSQFNIPCLLWSAERSERFNLKYFSLSRQAGFILLINSFNFYTS